VKPRGLLWFVVPALDERENLPHMAPRIDSTCEDLEEDYQVVLVDDGSSDGTGEVALELWGERCTVLRHPTNQGPGRAVRTGLLHVLERATDDDLLITLEADGTSDLTVLSPMLAFARSGWDVALASPYAPGGGVEQTNALRLGLSAGANILCKHLLGIRDVSTYSSFYRTHRVDALRRLHARWGERVIEEQGFSYAVEMLCKLCGDGARLAEVPVVLDGAQRIGESRMRLLPTILGYLRLFRRYGRLARER
jgi:dolichol-phosphate mannosyltransferase